MASANVPVERLAPGGVDQHRLIAWCRKQAAQRVERRPAPLRRSSLGSRNLPSRAPAPDLRPHVACRHLDVRACLPATRVEIKCRCRPFRSIGTRFRPCVSSFQSRLRLARVSIWSCAYHHQAPWRTDQQSQPVTAGARPPKPFGSRGSAAAAHLKRDHMALGRIFGAIRASGAPCQTPIRTSGASAVLCSLEGLHPSLPSCHLDPGPCGPPRMPRTCSMSAQPCANAYVARPLTLSP